MTDLVCMNCKMTDLVCIFENTYCVLRVNQYNAKYVFNFFICNVTFLHVHIFLGVLKNRMNYLEKKKRFCH